MDVSKANSYDCVNVNVKLRTSQPTNQPFAVMCKRRMWKTKKKTTTNRRRPIYVNAIFTNNNYLWKVRNFFFSNSVFFLSFFYFIRWLVRCSSAEAKRNDKRLSNRIKGYRIRLLHMKWLYALRPTCMRCISMSEGKGMGREWERI